MKEELTLLVLWTLMSLVYLTLVIVIFRAVGL